MGLETATYISGLNASNPTSGDPKAEGDNHIRLLKSTLLATFPSITAAVTATHAELNLLDGVTATTAELNTLDGVTATATEINKLDGVTVTTAQINGVGASFTDCTANTQAAGDNSTKLATTAFMQENYIVNSYPTIDSGTSGKFLTNDGSDPKWETVESPIPVGSIIAFIPGYFTDTSNGGFTAVVTNTAAGVNTYVGDNWKVCDGSELNDSSSTYYDGTGRYLPNLTDDRFIMGDTVGGGIGGDNAMAHTHTMAHIHSTANHTLTIAQMPSHTHQVSREWATSSVGPQDDNEGGGDWRFDSSSAGGGGAHNHGNTGAASNGTTSAASVTENRPKFLSCFYLMRVR